MKLQTNTTNTLVVTQGINIKSSCKWANLGQSIEKMKNIFRHPKSKIFKNF